MARSNAVGKLSQIIESELHPKEGLLSALGDLSQERLLHSQVLVAVHPGTKYHPGTKILRTDRDLQEIQYQASIGLVVKVGPGAFKDAPGAAFHGEKAIVGDWVLTRPADGLQLLINEVPCRIFEDVNIKMVVSDPERYW